MRAVQGFGTQSALRAAKARVTREVLAFAHPPWGAPGAEVARSVRHLAPGLARERSSASMHASQNAEYQKTALAVLTDRVRDVRNQNMI